jgi:intracellular sulfur oxidation DsrE/DsrF family protein
VTATKRTPCKDRTKNTAAIAGTHIEPGRTLMKKLLAIILLSVVANGITGASFASDRYGKQKVVYHVNYNGGEADKAYRAALRNIQNHINAVGKENLDVKVVLHGNGVGLLKNAVQNQKLQMDVTSLKTQNVAFAVCDNTLTGRKINYETDLFEVFKDNIVPSGVAELSRLQQQGYTYIKP